MGNPRRCLPMDNNQPSIPIDMFSDLSKEGRGGKHAVKAMGVKHGKAISPGFMDIIDVS